MVQKLDSSEAFIKASIIVKGPVVHFVIHHQYGKPTPTNFMAKDGNFWNVRSSNTPQISPGSKMLYLCGDAKKENKYKFFAENHAAAVDIGFLVEDLLRQLNAKFAAGEIDTISNFFYEFD